MERRGNREEDDDLLCEPAEQHGDKGAHDFSSGFMDKEGEHAPGLGLSQSGRQEMSVWPGHRPPKGEKDGVRLS